MPGTMRHQQSTFYVSASRISIVPSRLLIKRKVDSRLDTYTIVMHLNVLQIFVLSIIGFWIQRFIRRRRNVAGLPLPPGLSGLPLLGNLFNFPKTDAWLTGAQWGKTYGKSQSDRN
jgi:hypothetical protein